VLFQQEVAAFPEYYAEYFKQAMMGGTLIPITPVVCVGPVKYRGEKLLQVDIDNVKAAAKAAVVPANHAFLPATAPSGVGINEFYKSDEEYFHALAGELNKEYRTIVAAVLVQVDDPFLPDIFFERARRRAEEAPRPVYVEATNRALQGIPRHGAFPHLLRHQRRASPLRSRAVGYHRVCAEDQRRQLQFRGGQPRHEHEYHLFERVKVPDGKVLCPGVITHASNIVEHPELIAGGSCASPSWSDATTSWLAPTAVSHRKRCTALRFTTRWWEKFKAMRRARTSRQNALDNSASNAGANNREDEMRITVAGIAVLVALNGPAAARDIKIGFLGTFTGPLSAGSNMRDAAELALDKMGRKMGGRPITVIYEDDQLKPEVGKQKTEKLIQSDRVDLLTGYLSSAVLLASIKTVADAQIILVGANAGLRRLLVSLHAVVLLDVLARATRYRRQSAST
jgi:5-methyltetrahydropteroyltriglutamate--homocysteine methyltransferase